MVSTPNTQPKGQRAGKNEVQQVKELAADLDNLAFSPWSPLEGRKKPLPTGRLLVPTNTAWYVHACPTPSENINTCFKRFCFLLLLLFRMSFL